MYLAQRIHFTGRVPNVFHWTADTLCDRDYLLLLDVFNSKRMATQAVHFIECEGLWSISSGASVPQYTQLLLLTCPPSQKDALSLHQTSSGKSGSSSILFSNHKHITKRLSMSAGVILCLIWILYDCSWRFFFKILL